MTKRIACLVACAVVLVAGDSHADSIKPIEGKSIDLGTFGGIAYYTVKPEGYQLVVTLTPSGANTSPLHRHFDSRAVCHALDTTQARRAGDRGKLQAPRRRVVRRVPRIGEAAD